MGEIDVVLRYLATQFADTLAKTYGPKSGSIVAHEWVDSVLTARERRLDKALMLTIDGQRRLLHLEFQWEWRSNMTYRVFEYQAMLAQALHKKESARATPIKTVVVLLNGPRSATEPYDEFRLSWPDEPFGGVRFQIDRIYAAKMSDLMGRGDGFWLALAPLTRDAGVPNLKEVLEHLQHTEEDPARLADIVAAMTILADNDPRGRGLGPLITEILTEEMIMQSSIGKRLWEDGLEKGLKKGLKKGREQGLEKGLEQALLLQFQHRVRRELTNAEQRRLHGLFLDVGLEKLMQVVLDIEDPEELLAWFHKPGANGS